MSESILNALMHLFAVIATLGTEGITESGKKVVRSFLRQHLKEDIAEEYFSLFEDYMDFYRRDRQWKVKNEEWPEYELDERQINHICAKISRELHRNERIIVLLRLIEFIFEDLAISDAENRFVNIVARTFGIGHEEFRNAKSFLTGNDFDTIDEKHLLVIEKKQGEALEDLEGAWVEANRPADLEKSNVIYNHNLDGRLVFLHLSSAGIFIFRLFGNDEMHVEGQKIIPGRFYILNKGSIIRGPRLGSIYYSQIAGTFLQSKEVKITFNAENIAFNFKNSPNGIKPFGFSEESGNLIGIMGGSGTGKSTLLNMLSGQLPLNQGKISINGYDLHREQFKLKGVIGFVPQDDLLIEELTVYQNLHYNARLCFRHYSSEQLAHTVNRMLDDLDLSDIRNLKVGNPLNKMISGGQRKRLNISLELMREPSILFVDEPTSGLSSMDAEKVINLLKEQTIKGKLVIANIHQPSAKIFRQFDKLWVLDRGGYIIYTGNPIDAIEYFKTQSSYADPSEAECSACGHVNPELILEIVESREVDEKGRYTAKRRTSPEEWYALYLEKIQSGIRMQPSKRILPRTSFMIPEIDKQFFIFLERNLRAKLTDVQYLLISTLEAPFLAIILAFFTKHISSEGYIFSANKNLPQYLFMAVIVSIFIGLTISAEEIIKDRRILLRESFLNLSRFSYLNSKIVYLFMLSAAQMIIFVLIGNAILEIRGMALTYWVILLSAAAFSNMLGLNISSGLDSVVSIYILVPLILIPQLLLSGVIVKFDELHASLTNKINVPVIGDLMTSRWAVEAISVEQFKSNRFEKHFYEYDRKISQASFKTSFIIPRLQNILEECGRNLNAGAAEENADNLQLMKNEITEMSARTSLFPFEYISGFNTEDFDQEIMEETFDYLTYAKFHFLEIADRQNMKRDSVYNRLAEKLGEDGVILLKQNHHNEQLADHLLDRNEIEKIIRVGNRLIQKKDPVYKYPRHNWGRAHFYAPVKIFNYQVYDTLIFNLILIWIFTFILYVTLLTDLLRKTIRTLTRFRILLF